MNKKIGWRAALGMLCLAPLMALAQSTGLWWQQGTATPTVQAPPAAFTYEASPSVVHLRAGTFPETSIWIDLSPPPGQSLQPGAYESTQRWPFNGLSPGLDVTVGSGGCNTSTGRFKVLEAAFDGSTLVSLAVDFQHDCMSVYGELRINSSVPYTVNKPPLSITPDPMAFAPRTFVEPGATVISNDSAVFGINAPAPISIAGGSYSINGGPFTAAPGTVNARDRVRVMASAPASPGGSTIATLTVGGVSAPFTVASWTVGSPITGARLQGSAGDWVIGGQAYMGVAPEWRVTATGSQSSLSVSLSFGSRSFNIGVAPPANQVLAAGPYENAVRTPFRGTGSGLEFTGDGRGCNQIRGRFVILELELSGSSVSRLALDFEQSCDGQPPSYGEIRIDSAIPFTLQKPANSTTPHPFAFLARTNVAPGGTVISNDVSVLGTNAPSPVSITNGQYSLNGGAFTSTPGTVNPRDHVRVRATAPSGGGGATLATLDIGGMAAVFQVAAYAPGTPLTALHVEGGHAVHALSPEWSIRTTSTNRGYLTFWIDGPNGEWMFLDIASPPGQELAVGAYEGAARAAFRGASPGIDLSGNGSGCNTTGGRFAVLDIAWDGAGNLARFAANFEQTCSGSMGEIRFNSAVPLTMFKPAGSTFPDPMAFATRDPVLAGSRVVSNWTAISGVNAPVPISITGGEYSINGGAYTVLPGTANNGDDIVVRVTASRTPGAAQIATLDAGGRIVTFTVRAYLPGTPLTAYAYRSSGDYIGAGRTDVMIAPPNVITAQRNFDNGVSLNVTGTNGENWSVSFTAPNDAPITAGTYTDAQRFPFQAPGRPGLSISGNGRGCNTLTGSFTVHEVAIDPAGVVQRFAADFQQFCEGGGPPLNGEIRFNSTVPLAALGGAAGPRDKRTFDANGDGRADILWQHADGRQALFLMEGGTTLSSATLLPAGTGWSAARVGDFNGDGKSDIVWTHADGRVALWLMQGTTQVGGGLLLAGGTGWMPKLVGDFDGDGKADLVWTHPDGRSAIWLMDGARQSGGVLLLNAGTGWTPKLLADFNGDGKSDILWEHSDGSSALWVMDGTRQIGGGRLFGAGTGWVSRFTGDFDGDGKSDILWTHTDGRAAMWIMNGGTQAGGALLLAGGTGYSPAFVTDLDRDGKADILWTGPATLFWLMNGTALKAQNQFFDASSGFAPLRVADFGGDGRPDMLTRHADGRMRVYAFDGTNFTAFSDVDAQAGWTAVQVNE